MTSRIAVNRAQLRALAAAAREEGCIAEVERDGVIYRVIPEALARNERQEKSRDSDDVDTSQGIPL